MKKIFAIISILFVLVGSFNVDNNFSLKKYFDGEYYVYTEQQVNTSSINLGSCYMTKDVEAKDCVGESLLIYNFEPVSALKQLSAKIIKTEKLKGGPTVLYAYSPLISRTVEIEGEKVNLQIANYNTYSVIGWPVILGSF